MEITKLKVAPVSLVTVIIPTLNRASQVVRAVSSVLNQTFKQLEVRVIDDGSTDDTREQLVQFSSDCRFFYRYQPNQGQSAARNVGIREAKGDFIALLDSDNLWYPDKLEKQISFLADHPGYDIVYSNIQPIDNQGRLQKIGSYIRFSGDILHQLVLRNFITNNTALVKRHCFEELGGYDEALRFAEDYDLWLRFATKYRFLYHPQTVASYTLSGDRVSTEEAKVLEANQMILTRFFEQFPHAVSSRIKRRCWSNLGLWKIKYNHSRNNSLEIREIWKLIMEDPTNVDTWLFLLIIIRSTYRALRW